MEEEILLELRNVTKTFQVDSHKKLVAVDNVSLKIKKGEIFGLVGESGCGKTTLGRSIVRLYDASSGEIIYKGKNIAKYNRKESKQYTREVQMIFQDPYASLDPRMTIGDIIKEGMKIHKIGTEKERDERMYELLKLVGLSQEHAQRFPYEFSGGQRQRVGIARALAVNPEFLVCDEPVSALDVSIQAQIINLLKRLQKQLGLTILFIAHDLSVVRYISDRVGVMYLGSLVEVAKANELYLNPLHPYTKGLMEAIPIADPHIENARERKLLTDDLPSPMEVATGCKFAGRCPYASDTREEGVPCLQDVGDGHYVACFRKEILFNVEEGNF